MRRSVAFLLTLAIWMSDASLLSEIRKKTETSLTALFNSFDGDTLWEAFKWEHNRSYSSITEELHRKATFRQNLLYILQHNMVTGPQTFRLGVNEYADLTVDEFTARMGMRSHSPLNHNPTTAVFRNKTDVRSRRVRDLSGMWIVEFDRREPVPKQLDWRANGIVTRPKNQGMCGNCWAHASAGAIEGVNALKSGVLTEVSVQQLVDCVRSPKYESDGCRGGYVDEAMEWAMAKGLASHASYPLTSRGDTGMCKKEESVAYIELYAMVIGEEDLQYALQYGPVVAAVSGMSKAMQLYASGVISSSCSIIPDHSVLVVGYDEDSWVVKNSWGTSWGEAGFFRLKRGKNMCGIASHMIMALD